MNSVLAFNDTGVAMMSTGDYEGASAAFTMATKQVRGCLQSSASSPSVPKCSALSSTTSSITTLRSVQVHDHSSTENHSAFAIFAECFITGDGSLASPQEKTDEMLAAVILYNGGLAFHLHSQKVCISTTSLLHRATRFYTMALHILLKTDMSTDQHWFLLLAISNNMAALAVETYEFKQFEKYRSIMGTVLMETGDVSDVFASNFVASSNIAERPAPAA